MTRDRELQGVQRGEKTCVQGWVETMQRRGIVGGECGKQT